MPDATFLRKLLESPPSATPGLLLSNDGDDDGDDDDGDGDGGGGGDGDGDGDDDDNDDGGLLR